ncbi:hypothetical protein C8R44DRAFT_755369 [Mycena epipterygia]|nr:hypothetical protein C8R44DRAFT_755369 [Mycena epipterygia]
MGAINWGSLQKREHVLKEIGHHRKLVTTGLQHCAMNILLAFQYMLRCLLLVTKNGSNVKLHRATMQIPILCQLLTAAESLAKLRTLHLERKSSRDTGIAQLSLAILGPGSKHTMLEQACVLVARQIEKIESARQGDLARLMTSIGRLSGGRLVFHA